MSRFELTYAPSALPGQCRLCGSATRLPMVDLKYSEEFYGAVYYCCECVKEFAALLNLVDLVRTNEVTELISTITRELSNGNSHPSSLNGNYSDSISGPTLSIPVVNSTPDQIAIDDNGPIEQVNVENVAGLRADSSSHERKAKAGGASKLPI